MAKNAKSSESKSKVVIVWEPYDWDEFIYIKAKTQAQVKKNASGGLLYDAYNRSPAIWSCKLTTEESCCGFPVLQDFYGNGANALKLAKEIGEALNESLKENAVYMSAYVPEQKGYVATQKILVAAGFKEGVRLKSKHGKYDNIRYEWFTPTT